MYEVNETLYGTKLEIYDGCESRELPDIRQKKYALVRAEDKTEAIRLSDMAGGTDLIDRGLEIEAEAHEFECDDIDDDFPLSDGPIYDFRVSDTDTPDRLERDTFTMEMFNRMWHMKHDENNANNCETVLAHLK